MKFRTRLFLTWSILIIALWTGSLWPVRRTIQASFARMAHDAFAGSRQSLRSLQAEQVSQMRQACELVMSIPELRALIAESGSELTSENLASLQERLDGLSGMLGAKCVCVLNGRGKLIAQNHGSPWSTLASLNAHFVDSPAARALVTKLYRTREKAQDGLWHYDGRLYQVVGVPLRFGSEDVDGVLIVATPLTDELAVELARSHNCQVSFLANGRIVASSLKDPGRRQLGDLVRSGIELREGDRAIHVAGEEYRASYEMLLDPCSQTVAGGILVQAGMGDAETAQAHLWRDLLMIIAGGIGLAAIASFALSTAVTRPVAALVTGARRVAGGDLAVSIDDTGRGEIAELSHAFNDMVEQLRMQDKLRKMVEESRLASQAKSQFVANMSHEIRTPLNGVIGMTELLARTRMDEQQRRYVGLIKSSAEVLTTVINDVLDFSKAEAGKMELEKLDFDVHRLVSEVAELMNQRAARKGLAIKSEVRPGVTRFVQGDANRLRQVLFNLMNNAIKFTETGGITLRLTLAEAPAGKLGLKFEIIDTGIGIPPDRMGRLFQSFSQVDASTTRKYGGTGLGLAICKQLAELMGGKIGVESEIGKGSTFWFTAMFTPGDERAIQATAADGVTAELPRASRQWKILLAEDNEVNQIVATELLASSGYQLCVVGDGRKAVEAAATGQYDLILMDCQMPEMDGLEATREIRKTFPALPIVALTANASGVDRGRCMEAGMNAYCGKPFDPRELLETMEKLLKSNTSQPKPVETPVAAPVASTAQALRLDGLLARCGGKRDLAETVLRKFEAQAANTVQEMRKFAAAADAQGLARVSHSLKGTAGIVSADAVQRGAAEIERLAKASELGQVHQEIDKLAGEVGRVVEQIHGMLARGEYHESFDRR